MTRIADGRSGAPEVPPLIALATELRMGERPPRIDQLLWLLFVRQGRGRVLALIRCAQHAHRQGRPRLTRWLCRRLQREFGCYVQPDSRIAPGLKLPHPQGIVIGSGTRIGRNCTIFQQVTLGGARMGDWQDGRYPVLHDNVILFAGAKLIGGVVIGDGAVVGANAVVRGDVPASHVAVGVPARCLPLREGADTDA